jgi:hypothetical protein
MTAATIEIRIRKSDEADGRHLMHWPATRLDEVIPLVLGWGVAFADGAAYDDTVECFGQFAVSATTAYFEVIVKDPDVD